MKVSALYHVWNLRNGEVVNFTQLLVFKLWVSQWALRIRKKKALFSFKMCLQKFFALEQGFITISKSILSIVLRSGMVSINPNSILSWGRCSELFENILKRCCLVRVTASCYCCCCFFYPHLVQAGGDGGGIRLEHFSRLAVL